MFNIQNDYRITFVSGSDVNPMSQTLLVCTAHIHWDPEYSDVKLIQTMMLMHELKAFVDDILQKCNIPVSQKSDPNIVPLLLCGDFNSLPDSGNYLFYFPIKLLKWSK